MDVIFLLLFRVKVVVMKRILALGRSSAKINEAKIRPILHKNRNLSITPSPNPNSDPLFPTLTLYLG